MTGQSWDIYHAHVAECRVAHDMLQGVYSRNQFVKMRRGDNVRVSDPHPSNLMQSAPYVAWLVYDIPTCDMPDDGARFVLVEYCEGDVRVERYKSSADRDVALFLLERAL